MQVKLLSSKILFVDDDKIAQMLVKQILLDIGYRVELASDGLEALEKLAQNDFDMILSDINMPKMNGYELTQTIRSSQKSFRSIPIIGLTAVVVPEDLQRAKNYGMNDVMNKPINLNALRKMLEKPPACESLLSKVNNS